MTTLTYRDSRGRYRMPTVVEFEADTTEAARHAEILAGLAAIRDEIDQLRAEMRTWFAEILTAVEALGRDIQR